MITRPGIRADDLTVALMVEVMRLRAKLEEIAIIIDADPTKDIVDEVREGVRMADADAETLYS